MIGTTSAQGVPRFGYALVNEWYENRSKYPEHHVAIAAGWLAHQLADWYPHYACIRDDGELDDDPTRVADGLSIFAGFANALTIFGADLPAEFRDRKIRLRAIPAVVDSYPQDLKARKQLDENTLTIRIDGYNLKQDPAIGTVAVSRDSRGALDISIEIKADVVPGTHHVFVDIKDNNGVHSEYLDRKIVVGRDSTSGSPS